MLEQYLTPGWITLAISLVGFISFYLGKIILDYYPNNEDEALYYIVGFISFLTYILIPGLFFYYFPALILNLSLPQFFVFLVISILLTKYFELKFGVFELKRGLLSGLSSKIILNNIKKFNIKIKDKSKLDGLFNNLCINLPEKLTIIILGYIMIFIVINLIFFFSNWIIKTFIFITMISTFNKIIILHNAKSIKYPLVMIEDINKRKIKGKLIKQDSNYVVLYCNEKERYTFPRENIKNIKIEVNVNTKNVENKIDYFAKIYNSIIKKIGTQK